MDSGCSCDDLHTSDKPADMADWRTATLNSHLSSSVRLNNRPDSASSQATAGRTLPATRPLAPDDPSQGALHTLTAGCDLALRKSHCMSAHCDLDRRYTSKGFSVRAEKDQATSAEDNVSETQQALLSDTLAELKKEEGRIERDAWMFEQPRCTKR